MMQEQMVGRVNDRTNERSNRDGKKVMRTNGNENQSTGRGGAGASTLVRACQQRRSTCFFMFLFLLILLSSNVLAFGMKPTQAKFDFSPGQEYAGQFVVTTNPSEIGAAKIVLKGDLAEYIDIAKEVTLASDETSIPYTLRLPETLEPGEHVLKVLIEEDIPVEDEGITAKIRLTYKIIVTVPVPEKHISVKLDIKQGKDILGIVANIKNVGTLDVSQVSPQVTVTDSSGEEIGAVAMPPKALNVAQSATFEDTITTKDLKNGIYKATAAVAYDEGELEIAKEFAVGVPLATVIRKDTKFNANEINDFTFDVKSDWNEPLNGVTGTMSVSKDNERISTFASEPFDLAPHATTGVKSFFDARNIVAGNYDAVLTLTYPSGTYKDEFTISLFGADELESAPIPWVRIGLIAILVFNGLIAVYVVSKKVFKKGSVNQTLTGALGTYVNNARKRGLSDQQIKAQLLKAGWKNEQLKGLN